MLTLQWKLVQLVMNYNIWIYICEMENISVPVSSSIKDG